MEYFHEYEKFFIISVFVYAGYIHFGPPIFYSLYQVVLSNVFFNQSTLSTSIVIVWAEVLCLLYLDSQHAIGGNIFISKCSKLFNHAWWPQAITWTNADLLSVRSRDNHLRASSQEVPQPSITKVSLNITYLKFCSNLPGADELKMAIFRYFAVICILNWPYMSIFVCNILHLL